MQAHKINENLFVWISVALAIVFWLLESVLHVVIFQHEPDFILMPADLNELWLRGLVCGLFIAFGFYARHNLLKLHKAQAEREAFRKKLEESLTKVLSGYLSICAECKKIHDNEGNWIQVESYVRDHTEAQFSHSLCPDCSKKLYPDEQENP